MEFKLQQSPSQAQPDRSNISRIDGEWTPSIHFDSDGDLAVVYGALTGGRLGYYYTFGQLVFIRFSLVAELTHSTASGDINITGLPYTCLEGFQPIAAGGVGGLLGGAVSEALREQRCLAGGGAVFWDGITKAGYTDCFANAVLGEKYLTLVMSGSGSTLSLVSAADIPTGTTLVLGGTVIYTRAEVS